MSGADPVRGYCNVALPRERDAVCDAFIAAAVEAGYPRNPDYNDGAQEGFGYYQVNHDRGRRSSAFDRYLVPVRHQRRNLAIQSRAPARRLVLEGRTCTGVEFLCGGTRRFARARREVILCAGTIQSPQLLELSGIGSPAVLKQAGIALRHALPGVGENFRDHYAARLKWRVREAITFNERTRGIRLCMEALRYAAGRRGVLSLPIALGHGFVRSAAGETRPDLQFHFAPASYGPGSSRRLDRRPGMTIGVYPLRPESRGSIHIRSPDPADPPVIGSRFLDHEEDCRRLVAGMRIARHIVMQPALRGHVERELSPGPDRDSDDALLEYARNEGDTSYHPVGTCRLGSDPMAVVDHALRVRGLDGLRVVDASVMPLMVSGNTNAATMMIAEKAADMILRDHRRMTRPATGESTPVIIEEGDPADPEAAALVRRSEEYSRSLYPPASVHSIDVARLGAPDMLFLVARDTNTDNIKGCGALKTLNRSEGELKSIFVDETARGSGIGRGLVAALEEAARRKGMSVILLETGIRQIEAIALYESLGFKRRGPFAGYSEDPLSVFMEKVLT